MQAFMLQRSAITLLRDATLRAPVERVMPRFTLFTPLLPDAYAPPLDIIGEQRAAHGKSAAHAPYAR